MKTKVISIFLAVIMILSSFPIMSFSVSDVWNGTDLTQPETVDGVYQISNGAELAWFAAEVNRLGDSDTGCVALDAVLTDDIELADKEWTPIGKTAYIVNSYAGTFDGQFHTVSGLSVTGSNTNVGLFSQVYKGTVKNLSVEGAVNGKSYVGGIIGKLQAGSIENCSMKGTVTGNSSGTAYVGGIVGGLNSTGIVINGCANYADVKGVTAGGILGYYSNSAVIKNCYNTGSVTGKTRSAGIAGQLQKGSISYCYNTGNTDSGICGFSNAAITECYYLNNEVKVPGGTASGYRQITDADSLLAAINGGADKAFIADDANENGGYPILFWQKKEAPKYPVDFVAVKGAAVTGSTLLCESFSNDGNYSSDPVYYWSVSDDNEVFTILPDETSAVLIIPDTTEFVGKYLKVTAVGAGDSAASYVLGPVEKSETLIDRENVLTVKNAADSFTFDYKDIKEETVLPLVKEFGGADVVWTSSDESVIAVDGTVTLPESDIKSVKLTAKFVSGSQSAEKLFVIDVWSKNVNADTYLAKVLDDMEWNFKSLQPDSIKDTNIIAKFNEILVSKGYEGITVTVNSTSDESLIAYTGKIYYPERPSETFADGKQVQIKFNLTVGDTTVVYPEGNINALLIPWDLSDIKGTLECELDSVLAESNICAEGDTFDFVTKELNLPSCIRGEKYSFAWITWTASDSRVVTISDENRQNGADSVYNAYVGKINRDDTVHYVTLTATAENPTTEIAVNKSVDIVASPVSEEELNASLEVMGSILDFYTPDKLLVFGTKNNIDTGAVTNDIQLVIPKDVVTSDELAALGYGKYWDYWNYKFSVESSDTDVIEINSFRAYVYRPIGEDETADKNVTLTVTMTSKVNPLLSVKKDITVTVKHLSVEELNSSMLLMDKAKDSYSKGLLGANVDIYSVIDNLTPYREIVWNSDKSDVEFIYSRNDRTYNGIVTDEIPGWEAQEDWRTFKTSNRNLIANETLNLVASPENDTYVKISSVLTDEVFGKYYVKFKDAEGYNPEALKMFSQLYKQPVSAYIMLPGAETYTAEFAVMTFSAKSAVYGTGMEEFKNEVNKPVNVTFTLLGLDGEVLVEKVSVDGFTDENTVFDVFKKMLSENDLTYKANGSYVTEINGLAAKDYGNRSGWMYTVGGVYVLSYMNAQQINDGDEIIVRYVRDYYNVDTGFDNPEPQPEENILVRIINWFKKIFAQLKAFFESLRF